jgi:hypothetical protein
MVPVFCLFTLFVIPAQAFNASFFGAIIAGRNRQIITARPEKNIEQKAAA